MLAENLFERIPTVAEHEMTEEERKKIEARCQRRVMENLIKVGKKIGPRTRMVQIISQHGVVEGLRSMTKDETSGWNDLYLNGLLGYSVEATVVESLEFRLLFESAEILKMERELRDSGYEPKVPV